jgi:hypothetical protein
MRALLLVETILLRVWKVVSFLLDGKRGREKIIKPMRKTVLCRSMAPSCWRIAQDLCSQCLCYFSKIWLRFLTSWKKELPVVVRLTSVSLVIPHLRNQAIEGLP